MRRTKCRFKGIKEDLEFNHRADGSSTLHSKSFPLHLIVLLIVSGLPAGEGVHAVHDFIRLLFRFRGYRNVHILVLRSTRNRTQVQRVRKDEDLDEITETIRSGCCVKMKKLCEVRT